MLAAVVESAGSRAIVREVELDEPGPGEARVRLDASGVCHSDLSIKDGALQGRFPIVLGHEGTGHVVAVGAGVSGVSEGDRVILAWVPPCGRCHLCLGGQSNLCTVVRERRSGIVRMRWQGAPLHAAMGTATFAQETVVPVEALVSVDPDVPAAVAAIVGCAVMTGVGAAINTARVEPGSTVAVIGCGGVGLSAVQGARVAGAAVILAVDPVATKRDWASQLGATHVAAPEELSEKVLELTEGLGVDYAFEVVGRSATIRAAWDATRRGGTTVVVGAGSRSDPVTFTAGELFSGEKKLQGCVYGSADVRTDFRRVLNLWRAGRLELEKLITRTISLDQVDEAFAAMEAGEVIRSVILF